MMMMIAGAENAHWRTDDHLNSLLWTHEHPHECVRDRQSMSHSDLAWVCDHWNHPGILVAHRLPRLLFVLPQQIGGRPKYYPWEAMLHHLFFALLHQKSHPVGSCRAYWSTGEAGYYPDSDPGTRLLPRAPQTVHQLQLLQGWWNLKVSLQKSPVSRSEMQCYPYVSTWGIRPPEPLLQLAPAASDRHSRQQSMQIHPSQIVQLHCRQSW